MSQSVLALVEIVFNRDQDLKKGTGVIEKNLRKRKTASGFSVYEGKIEFQLWFDGQADYSVLNQIKDELTLSGLSDFTISTRELTETKQVKI